MRKYTLAALALLALAGCAQAAHRRAGGHRARLTAADIAYCSDVAKLRQQPLPRNGTTFCPTNKAFEAFAKSSGFRAWSELWAAAQAAPQAWSPYLDRILSHHSSAAYLPGSIIPDGASTVETDLEASTDAAGAPLAAPAPAKLSLLKRGNAMTIGGESAKKKAKVLQTDLLEAAGATVHSVDSVLMPPDTYPTLAAALKSDKTLSTMARYMRTSMKDVVGRASTFATIIAPSEDAWRATDSKPPYPAWTGNVASSEVRKSKDLQKAVLQYATVPLPQAGVIERPLSWELLLDVWKLAGARSFVSLSTALVVGTETQNMMYTFDAETGSIWLLGARNANAAFVEGGKSYMAGAPLGRRTLYAGCSTLLTAGGFVQLPRKTGVPLYDQYVQSGA